MSVYVTSHNILSPLGFTSDMNFRALLDNQTALIQHQNKYFSDSEFCASVIPDENINAAFSNICVRQNYTRFEKICILSINDALQRCELNLVTDRTLLILSTTKGNIDLIETDIQRSKLWFTAEIINNYFGFINKPQTISLACISGLASLIVARRYILSGKYDNIIICGADIFSRFVLSGFQSFQAISKNPCKPFDAERTGISLGEAASTIILSSGKPANNDVNIQILNGAITNDANHLSGPSREAVGLTSAIKKALTFSDLKSDKIDFISAHGTGTIYNDDMESLAFTKTELSDKPINSMKGYFGHTLGAAGIIESVATIMSMKESVLIRSLGFDNPGTPNPVNIVKQKKKSDINFALKTASGFGSGNAAIVLAKV